VYEIEKMKLSASEILKHYPETARCLSCNTCTRICPQDLKVMDAVQASLRGDLKKVARLSFECIMCGLCASRCPAELVQYNIFLLARRLYGRHGQKQAGHLKDRVAEIEGGKFKEGLKQLSSSGSEELIKIYKSRDIEPV